jgi:hypothetical protein
MMDELHPPPLTNTQQTKQKKKLNSISNNILQPPANIASPRFGSDVAARNHNGSLRAAVLHVPVLALKMSTALNATLPSAQIMIFENGLNKTHSHNARIPLLREAP